MDARGELKDEVMEENNNQDEEMQNVATKSESFVSLSDEDEHLMLKHNDVLDLESIIMQKPLSEKEINELIQDLVGVESKAAEGQGALEKEFLASVENGVREELAKILRGAELIKSVAAELVTFRDVWKSTFDGLELKSSNLLDQLDGAGIELTKLYKMIQSRVPNGCYTEAWRKRAHWVGTQVTKETVEALANAESHTHRPVPKQHGKLLAEGANGFLETKFAGDGGKECIAGTISEKKDEAVSFGSKNWASVYLASTPQQAAVMGLQFPGVNEVKVKDDRQLQLGLKRKGCKKSSKQQVHRNISKEEMLHLFEFEEAADRQNTSKKQKVGCCSDKLMENLLQRHNPNWINEHETLLTENEEEKLTKHVPVVVQKLPPSPSPPQTMPPRLPKRFNRSRFVSRNCTRTAHQLTLISQGIRFGSRTVCGECGLFLAWGEVGSSRVRAS